MLRVARKLGREWERRLKPFGLDHRTLDNQAVQHCCAPESAPAIQTYQHDYELRRHWLRYAERRTRLADSDLARMYKIPRQIAPRQVPDWAYSDVLCRALLLWLHPALATSESERARAGRDALIIYRAFRQCLTDSAIAEETGYSIETIGGHVKRLKVRAEEFFSYPLGAAPPRAKRGRKRKGLNLSAQPIPAPACQACVL